MGKARALSTSHPCVFKTPFLRETVDPQVERVWPDAPFGDLRRTWREQHCAELNPYESRWCPYRPEDCAISFLQGVQATVIAMPRNRGAYFRTVVHRSAMDRADRKPLARAQPGVPVGVSKGRDSDGVAEDRVRRAARRPNTVGDVLGSLNLRPHQGTAPDE